MSVNAVSSPKVAPQPPVVAQVRQSGRDSDGDNDGSSAKAVSAPVAPTTNTNGQKLGQRINVAA